MRHHATALLFVGLLAPVLVGQSETRTCEVQTSVSAKIECDECVSFPETDRTTRFEYDVRSNTAVWVAAESTPAIRFERDLDHRVMRTVDTLPTFLDLEFIERPQCTDGSPMEVRALGPNEFNVAPHRGGFRIIGRLTVDEATLCHDAGCYTATVTVTLSALPTEECR